MDSHSGRRTRWAYKPKSQRKPRVSTFAYKLAHRKPKRNSLSAKRSKPVKRVISKNSKECVPQTTKKYTSRPSPSYPANECCNQVKKGNDGNMYKSMPNKNGVCAWKRV